MLPADLLSVLSGAAVGLVLAVIGGGGSILATPLLLYVVGIKDPHVAIGTSAMAVSVNAFANLIGHARAGRVKWPCATVFAVSGVAGALLGAHIGKQTNSAVLLPLFALVMVAVGISMLRKGAAAGDPNVRLNPKLAPRLVLAGLIVGVLSGFFGIGGGFLIVPGLMVSSGMAMLNAVASSLLSVGTFGATTAASYVYDGLIDWRIAALFIAGGIAGGVGGMRIARSFASRRQMLQRVFAGVVFAVAAYMLYRSLPAVLGA